MQATSNYKDAGAAKNQLLSSFVYKIAYSFPYTTNFEGSIGFVTNMVYNFTATFPYFIFNIRGMQLVRSLIVVALVLSIISTQNNYFSVLCFYGALISLFSYLILKNIKNDPSSIND